MPTLHAATVGDTVNIETDVIAKYVEKLLAPQTAAAPADTTIDSQKLDNYRRFMNHKV